MTSVNPNSGVAASYVSTLRDTPAAAVAGNVDHKTLSDAELLQQISRGAKPEGLLKAPSASQAGASGVANSLGNLTETQVSADIYAVMALFQKMAQEQRNAAREVRTTEMQAQVGALKDAAQEIRNAAQERFVGAVVAGAMQIAGGVASIGAGAVSMGYAASAAKSNKLSGEFTEQAGYARAEGNADIADTFSGAAKQFDAKAGLLSAKAGFATATGQGSAGILGGVGGIVQATQEKKAAEHDASKAELEANAKVHDSAVQQANDLMQQMMDVIRDVKDKLGAIEQSRLETNRGIARNI